MKVIPGQCQNMKVLNHMIDVGSITFLEAWTLYSVRCLTRRIADLRQSGFDIETQLKRDNNGQRYARYSLAPVN